MANICSNRFYCSTDNERNYETMLYFINEIFDPFGLEGQENWMRGEFDSRWVYPEKEMAMLIEILEPDPTLFLEIISIEPGSDYLEAHIYQQGEWTVLPE